MNGNYFPLQSQYRTQSPFILPQGPESSDSPVTVPFAAAVGASPSYFCLILRALRQTFQMHTSSCSLAPSRLKFLLLQFLETAAFNSSLARWRPKENLNVKHQLLQMEQITWWFSDPVNHIFSGHDPFLPNSKYWWDLKELFLVPPFVFCFARDPRFDGNKVNWLCT